MRHFAFALVLALSSVPAMAQDTAVPAVSQTPAPAATAPQQPAQAAPVPSATVQALPAAPAIQQTPLYEPGNGNFGPNSTCQTATKPTSKSYSENLRAVMARYPGYSILDEHRVSCGAKDAMILVLISTDGSKPSRLHAIELQ